MPESESETGSAASHSAGVSASVKEMHKSVNDNNQLTGMLANPDLGNQAPDLSPADERAAKARLERAMQPASSRTARKAKMPLRIAQEIAINPNKNAYPANDQ